MKKLRRVGITAGVAAAGLSLTALVTAPANAAVTGVSVASQGTYSTNCSYTVTATGSEDTTITITATPGDATTPDTTLTVKPNASSKTASVNWTPKSVAKYTITAKQGDSDKSGKSATVDVTNKGFKLGPICLALPTSLS